MPPRIHAGADERTSGGSVIGNNALSHSWELGMQFSPSIHFHVSSSDLVTVPTFLPVFGSSRFFNEQGPLVPSALHLRLSQSKDLYGMLSTRFYSGGTYEGLGFAFSGG